MNHEPVCVEVEVETKRRRKRNCSGRRLRLQGPAADLRLDCVVRPPSRRDVVDPQDNRLWTL